jgi:hypothetical protein
VGAGWPEAIVTGVLLPEAGSGFAVAASRTPEHAAAESASTKIASFCD